MAVFKGFKGFRGFGRTRKPGGRPGEWYYCLEHGEVEEGPECPAKNRMGPYATPAEAGQALRTAADRNDAWETDPRWHDGRSDEKR
jgi:hypothetical protein